MIAEIKKSTLSGKVEAPPSKSMSHRMLICSGLATGTSIVRGIAPSQDVLATLDCLKAIGATYEYDGDTVVIEGTDARTLIGDVTLPCRESGSTLRFFLPLCLLGNVKATFTGSERLFERPLEIYKNLCLNQGIRYESYKNSVCVKGKLKADTYKIQGNVSSQFISGLLFALPLLKNDSIIDIVPPIESSSYIKLTMQALALFGVNISWLDERTLFIKGNQTYLSRDVNVEGDYSNAAFFDALNYLGSSVNVLNLNPNSIQGDKVYSRYFDMMQKGTPTISISDCPDLGPVLFAVASAHFGGVFTGTRRLKLKESDRAAAMAQELAKFGISVRVEEDTVIVYPTDFKQPQQSLFGHNDHRIVMALSILLTKTGGIIEGAEAVSKSMPDFFDKMRALGMEVTLYEKA